MATLFTRIIKGEIPSHKVYEDEQVCAFLDIGPLSNGHVLVVPKEEVATVDLLSDESAAAVGRVLPRIARAVMTATGAKAFNILQNNGALAKQAVMHVHFHIIPRHENGTGLAFQWEPGPLKDGEGLAGAIRENLKQR